MRFLIVTSIAFAAVAADLPTLKTPIEHTAKIKTSSDQLDTPLGSQTTSMKLASLDANVPMEMEPRPAITPETGDNSGPSVPELARRMEVSTEELCEALADAARANDIPIAFFARLIWQESRFKAGEVSPVGAQGVAQFMPATAVEMGLDDPFDPLQALPASARFLRRLHQQFGNLGLAAAAYNAGSGRVQNWLARRGELPLETRNYVRTITGNTAENWIVESRTVGLSLALPPKAPCEGVAGLSRRKDVATFPVALTATVSAILRKAELEAQRAAIAAAEAAARVRRLAAKNSTLAKFASAKSKHKQASRSAAEKRAPAIVAAVHATMTRGVLKVASHPGRKSADRPRGVRVASAANR